LIGNTKKKLEYLVAKDQDKLYEVLDYQLHILQSGLVDGGWISMYETTNEFGNKSSIGMAAELYLRSSNLLAKRYTFHVDSDDFRNGY
jgi:hypothetical protein